MLDQQTIIYSAIDEEIWVIKVGSAMITDHGLKVDYDFIDQLAAQIAVLKSKGKKVILVSSGAIAVGLKKLNWPEKPKELAKQQAAAAVGQMSLAKIYEEIFQKHNIQTAQVLLTHEDASDRKRYLNIKSTLEALLDHDILPIVNENDTVSYAEIKFGDNDNLGALVANLLHAGLYVILTDQKGLYDQDPRTHQNAKLISYCDANDDTLVQYVGKSKSNVGSGGMLTKIQAAKLASHSNTPTIITHGQAEKALIHIYQKDYVGTFFAANSGIKAKKQWVASHLKTKGQLTIDQGAEAALQSQANSLLAVGVTHVAGTFSRGAVISVINSSGKEIAKGICNYNSEDCRKILGTPSNQIAKILGYSLEKQIIHYDNLVLL